MKVLLLTDRMDAGGAETHIAQLATELSKKGIEVSVFSGGGRIADALEKKGIRQFREDLFRRDPARVLLLRARLKRLVRCEGFDVLHAHARFPAFLLRGFERLGVAVIVSVHAMFRSNRLLQRLCYWGQYTVAVSEDLRAYVCERYRVAPERVQVIANGIDCKRFSPLDRAERDHGQKRILFASRLDADCALGAELLCRAAPKICQHFPDAVIQIAGEGSHFRTVQRLARQANEAIGREAVVLCGWVADMPSLLREQDIFVGVSRAALEACAVGCAVILCGNEGYLGVLDGETLDRAMLTNFCARGAGLPTLERLTADLLGLLKDDALRLRAARECREAVILHYGAEQMCEETLALYQRALPRKFERTVVAAGYFGCGNLGDDAILLGLLEGMRECAPNVRVKVLCGSPAKSRRRFGVSCVGRMNPFAVLFAILGSDALLFGGGSLLQNRTGNNSLRYYLALIRLAELFCRPIFFFASGIGPLIGEKAERKVRDAMKKCVYVGLRDADSLRYLQMLGTDAALLHRGGDAAWLMPPPPKSRSGYLLQRIGTPMGQGIICLVLRGGRLYETERSILLTAVRLVCRRNRLYPLLLLFDEKHDGAVTEEAAKKLRARVFIPSEPADALAIFSVARITVSMRLHALVLSAAAGVCALGVSADPNDGKIASFGKACGMPAVHGRELTAGRLVDELEQLLSCRQRLRPVLSDSVSGERKKAEKDLENIVKMLYNDKEYRF